jgi:hypothetical protein
VSQTWLICLDDLSFLIKLRKLQAANCKLLHTNNVAQKTHSSPWLLANCSTTYTSAPALQYHCNSHRPQQQAHSCMHTLLPKGPELQNDILQQQQQQQQLRITLRLPLQME